MLIALILFLIVVVFARANRQRILEDEKIQAYEKSTGHRWLREGKVNKGGQNGPPSFPRPAPPTIRRS